MRMQCVSGTDCTEREGIVIDSGTCSTLLRIMCGSTQKASNFLSSLLTDKPHTRQSWPVCECPNFHSHDPSSSDDHQPSHLRVQKDLRKSSKSSQMRSEKVANEMEEQELKRNLPRDNRRWNTLITQHLVHLIAQHPLPQYCASRRQ
eukprot:1169552-Rhodomonas_salina.1